jgi:hypothetical protein
VLSSILSFLIKKDFIKKWGTFFLFFIPVFFLIIFFFDLWNFNKRRPDDIFLSQFRPSLLLRFSGYTTNGTLSVVSGTGRVVSSSDVRLKKEINQFDEVEILDKLKLIKPKTYKWIDSTDDNLQLGYIAQEVETIFPFEIDGKKHEYKWELDKDNMNKPKVDARGNIVYKLDASGNKIIRPRGFQDRAFIAYLHLGINALIDENEDLKNQITIQKTQLSQLQDKISALEDSVSLLLSKF